MGTGLHGETAISGGKKPMGEVTPPIQDRPETEPNDAGEPGSDQLMALVYDELRALAAAYMKGERAGHTLQPTALVHEAYMRLAGLEKINWKDKTHFHAAAAGAIRRVLVDHARGKRAAKRGGGRERITISGVEGMHGASQVDLLALEEAMAKLTGLDERKARVVELRFFGGLTIDETARTIGVSTTTVEDDWAFARAWLRSRLGGREQP